MTRRNISNDATVRELIGLSPRSMHATVLACIPSASASADCVSPNDSRRARRSAGRIAAAQIAQADAVHLLGEHDVAGEVAAVRLGVAGVRQRNLRVTKTVYGSGDPILLRLRHMTNSVLRCDSKVLSRGDSVKGQL